jgi:hypothetical protein
MMSRVVITLGLEERKALIEWAGSELRTPSDQARFIIRVALQKKGLLNDSEKQTDYPYNKNTEDVVHGTLDNSTVGDCDD